ncbi:unnamed protein product [Effrenium voratum]|nr:unnamed protein product [Effrenium voratum]
MQRLQGLAAEVLALPNLTAHQRLMWATSLRLDAVPVQELPPWFWERQNITRRTPGVDLLSLDGRRGIRCCAEAVEFQQVRRFLRLAKWVYKASDCVMVTSSPDVLSKQSQKWLRRSKAKRQTLSFTAPRRSRRLSRKPSKVLQADSSDPPLRPCQRECLEACAKGARVIEMACGTGKTRVMKELVRNISGRVLLTVPLRALLEQFAEDFPGFCKVGTGYNKHINWNAKGFLAVTDSVRMLKRLEFDAIFVDEAHHPQAGFPKTQDLYRFSATHWDEPDFRYSMGQAMEDRILCDYDLTVPVVTPHHGHTYLSLADLLLKQAGRFRRILAYCNSVQEAKSFRMVLRRLGMAAWHMNGGTQPKKRQKILEQFSGALQKPVHVLVTVEVLGEGINIPNADTCMFVEPRGSYRSIVQAIGRVLRPHPTKPLAHIVLPAVALTPQGSKRGEFSAPHDEHTVPMAQVPPELSDDSDDGLGRLRNPGAATGKETTGLLAQHVLNASLFPSRNTRAAQDKRKLLAPQTDHVRVKLLNKMPIDGSAHHMQKQDEREDARLATSAGAQILRSGGLRGSSEDGAGQQVSSTTVTTAKAVAGSHPQSLQMAGAATEDLRRQVRGLEAHQAPQKPKRMNAEAAAEKWQGRRAPGTPSHELVLRPYDANMIAHDVRKLSRGKVASAGLAEGKRSESAASLQATWVLPDHVKSPAVIANPTQYCPSGGRAEPALRRRGQKLAVRWRAESKLASGFNSQLQRFFAALVRADHRLFGLGRPLGQRVQVVDCSRAWRKVVCINEVTDTIFAELAAVLRKQDLWDLRFRDLERFISKHGRLPRETARRCEARSLCFWLQNQGAKVRSQQMLPHRLHRFLNATSPLIRKRVQVWMDLRRPTFERKCEELREYILANGTLPSFSRKHGFAAEYNLAAWLRRQTRGISIMEPMKWKMLEDIHPLVKAKLHSESTSIALVNVEVWQARLRELLGFVARERRLPQKLREGGLYKWLLLQRRRFRYGKLPSGLALQLQKSHWLIAELFQQP